MGYFCSFCTKIEEEVPLIELSSNLLFIGKSHYDFTFVFYELFKITAEDLPSNFICETCKDLVVQFFIFKNNAAVQMNRHRKMIALQIEDFLMQCKNIEDVQVIRKFSSITLQIDDNPSPLDNEVIVSLSPKYEEEEDQESFDECNYEEMISEQEDEEDQIFKVGTKNENNETVEIMSDYLPCSKCSEVLTKKALEVHEFFNHSSIGTQIQSEIEQIREEEVIGDDGESQFVRKCPMCLIEFCDLHILKQHLLVSHSDEFLLQVNGRLSLETTKVDLILINKYIQAIKDLLQTESTEIEIDENVKSYFYQFYSGEVDRIDHGSPQTMNPEHHSESDQTKKVVPVDKKLVKRTMNLNTDSRAWLREEINLRKKTIKTENGNDRVIYRCVYCNLYSSNSAPGFRYHLMCKHLKDYKLKILPEIGSEINLLPSKTNKGLKNVCTDCNLKFKDRKLFESHQNAHGLLSVIAKYYLFPTCNTCNKLFIDEETLNVHLAKHDSSENLKEPIQVPVGALMMQGKQTESCLPEENREGEADFWWSCGHCSQKFQNEFSGRNHLLLYHATVFTCPIDKREFSEHKAVSLFLHHLKNKHPELFPDIVFTCTFCKINLPTIYEKLSHMKSCSFKKFACDHCGKRFFKKGDLSAHLRFVSGELFFACKICHKKCETVSDLKIHLRSHTKEKPFPCSLCDKTFRTLAARSAHVECHNTSVEYNCVCGKSFRRRQIYRRHVKAVHETETKMKNISTLSSLRKIHVTEEEIL